MNGPAPDPLLEAAVLYLSRRNFERCRSYAVKAQSSPALVTDATKILAISDTLAAGETRISETLIDWYAILHVYKYSQDTHLINQQFKKLSLLLYPQENKYPFAKEAFKLVCEAGSVLTNETKKSQFDHDLQVYETRIDESFWTICPYCYVMYEYVRVYEDCCLLCQNVKCGRGFHGFEVEAPPLDVVENGVYKCMGFFPLGFDGGKSEGKWNPFSPLVGVKRDDREEKGGGSGLGNEGDFIDLSDESDGLEDGGGGKSGDDQGGRRREVGGDDCFGGSVMKRRKKSVPINANKLMGKGPRARRMENVGQEGLDLNARAGEDNAGGNSNGNEVPGVGGVEMGNGADFDAGVELLAGDDDIFVSFPDCF
ncbi:J domain-containing protein [Heracleum sosnowskyi]|uniref:J domain-containing protein n=1 Tax=Heracleum sosnowskyi TaxID=360622 RepID=A0AAD8IVL1_9APIA|nr:J domain-containing protein [Heracleum sosnowskyi]